MDEGEQNSILVIIPKMLGKNPHHPHAGDAAIYDSFIAQGGYVDKYVLEKAYDDAKRAVSSSSTTGKSGEGKSLVKNQ